MPNCSENVYDRNSNWITGEVQDVIIDRDGNRTELPKDHNLVVASCSVLIASFFKSIWDNDADGGNNRTGIKYWAIGTGADPESSPASTDTQLENEGYRQEITPGSIVFVDGDGNEVDTPTRRIKIVIVVGYEDGNIQDADGNPLDWTEFGIFAGPTATAELRSGVMINRKIHGSIAKTENIMVERTLIFTF